MYRTDFTAGLDVEGPLGFKMKEKAAVDLEAVLKAEGMEKDPGYRRYYVEDLEYTKTKERSDVSWITKESPDKQQEVILTDGINDSIIRRNNIVTINHSLPAVGENVWLKKEEVDGKKGMKAQTKYLPRPEGFDARDTWVGDRIFNLVVQKAMTGKSVGILPVPGAVRGPTQAEVDENPDWYGCKVYERSYLVEYAVCPNPVHPEALTLTVTKSFPEEAEALIAFLGLPKLVVKAEPELKKITMIPVGKILPLLVKERIRAVNFRELASGLTKHAIYRKTGRIVP